MRRLAMFAGGGIFGILMLCLEVVQMGVAAIAFENWLGCSLFWAIVCIVILSDIFPIATTVIGIYSAIAILDWNVFGAIALFAPMLIVNLLLLSGVGIAAVFEIIKGWFSQTPTRAN